MTSIKFFTPVNYGDHCQTLAQFALEKVDAYFYLGGRKAQVIPGHRQGKSEGTVLFDENASFFKTALKVATYFTLVIPALMLVAKVILRWTHPFHLIGILKQQTLGLDDNDDGCAAPTAADGSKGPNVPPNPNKANEPRNLIFDIPTRLSAEETCKLRIRVQAVLDQNGQVHVRDRIGLSDLPQFRDSYFTWIQGELEGLIDDDGHHQSRREFDYEVTRHKLDGDYPHLSHYRPLKLDPETYLKLKLDVRFDKARGVGVATSPIAEYNNSQFFVIETPDNMCVCTRILKV